MDVQAGGAGPLHGVRVLEFSQIVAGPVAGLNLADLGADVIKVESPKGDSHRFANTSVPGESKMYQGNNRGKRSLVVDLGNPEGLRLIHRLLPTIDVVLVNFRPSVVTRIGIDYESLKAIRPDIIYAQISGFGDSPERASRAGSDIVAQAHSGLMAMNANIDEEGCPQVMGIPVSDYAAGLAIAMAVCAALYHRKESGEGQLISTSLLRMGLHLQNRYVMREPVSDSTLRDPMVERLKAARANGATFAELSKIRDRRAQVASPFSLYYRAYQAMDGHVVLGALTPANRNVIRRVLNIDDDSDSPDFDALAPESHEAIASRKPIIEAIMRTKRVDEWVAIFQKEGVPVAPVNYPEEMTEDPDSIAEALFMELEHSVTGPQKVVGPTVTMSATPTGNPLAAPSLGEHTCEVLREAGLTAEEIAQLEESGVVRG